MMSTAYGIGAVAVCGECGELISLARVPAAEGELWIHTGSGLSFCYREQRHTETAWPDPGIHTAGGADPVVLGFVVQCGICPQQAVVLTQPEPGWLCPRCAEVAGPSTDGVVDAYISCGVEHPVVRNHHCALPEGHESVVHATEVFTWPRQAGDPGFGDVDVAQAEPAAAVRLDLTNGQYPNVMAQAGLDDDDYPIEKVQG